MNQKNILIILIYLLSFPTYAKDGSIAAADQNQPANRGNFALSASQQPGPLVSFGQNIIDKKELQFFIEPTYLSTTSINYLAATPSLLYGLSDISSLFISLPAALNYRGDGEHSSGLSDALFQLEYAFYEGSNSAYTQQATIVAATTMPTGSLSKSPPTGAGTPTFFLGTTYNVMFVDWLWFVSPGVYLPTAYKELKQGNEYLYQFGVDKVIASKENKYIIAGMVELNGIYTEKTRFGQHVVPNTGGNIIGITPSLWYSTNKFIAQLGLSIPVIQKLNGDQSKANYVLAFNVTWTIS
ncbi:hypothetical protein [uncultured Legionella sp.]|uniref:hypothetical protein n=1 Tax=uncultured Legionella sp. TaxID=210934 RepID=UPI002633931D|nr:hypothetical protein [uncultured Legionella sp.]